MKSYLPKIAFSLLFYLSFSTFAHAQKSMQELAELNDKKWDKLVKSYKNNSTWIDQLQGLLNEDLVSEDNLPNPKKIGVLTMQIWDYSQTSSSTVAQTTVYTKNYLTPEGSNLVAETFLETMLPIFEDKFKAKGITLLEPDEYLTDAEKRKIYEEGPSRIDVSGLVKTFGAITSFLTNADKGEGSATASGYEFYPISVRTMATDFKAPATLGLLVEDLDLDAVLILSVGVSLIRNGRTLVLHEIEAGIVGPIDDDQSKEYKGRIGAGIMNMYRDGLSYSSVILEVEPFEIAKINKSEGSIEDWQLDGLDVVSSRMAADLIRGMEKFVALDKSKD
ncbi:hypothetical protein OU792_05845 [Algoriphagus sp. NF]|uniref:hypothetical protein n=1 Tax=Algoriphagus sp. NF TaxID=2992756 RepID=UPI00237BD4C9|nr:hypothetical protein [Algoriphagus sp. NF]MDE0559502.1 hypothetical protein [Algoriphagus sp. NF]